MRRKRDFLIMAALVTLWFGLAQPPRLGMADHWGASWKAGWPLSHAVWTEHPAGVTHNYEFRPFGLLANVATWLALTAVWFFTWPRSRAARPVHGNPKAGLL